MRKRLKKIRKKSGTTLVEMIVSMLLVELVAVMAIGILSPASKMFVRIQKTQFAQMILDNVAEEMKTQLQSAVGTVKVYNGDVLNAGSVSDSGSVLEYMNTSGYVVLMSADGCEKTNITRSDQQTGTSVSVEPGKLLMRYYWPDMSTDGQNYTYSYRQNGTLAARTVNRMFTDTYYMGNYLKLNFQFPPGTAENAEVTYLIADIGLYSDKECTKLVAEENVVLNIRYQTRRAKNMPPTAVSR